MTTTGEPRGSADGLTGQEVPATTSEDIRAREPETSSARIIPPDRVGDSSVAQEGEAPAGGVNPDSGGAVSTATAEGDLDDAILSKCADQGCFDDALLLYAKERRRAGLPPPAWNLWQRHANAIANLFSETREFRGKTSYFAEKREMIMRFGGNPGQKRVKTMTL